VIVGAKAYKLINTMTRPFAMEQSKSGVQKPFFIIVRLNEHTKMPFIFKVSISQYLSSQSDYKNISKCYYRLMTVFQAIFYSNHHSRETVDKTVMAACILYKLLSNEHIPYPHEILHQRGMTLSNTR
jgi:hypothetical protein